MERFVRRVGKQIRRVGRERLAPEWRRDGDLGGFTLCSAPGFSKVLDELSGWDVLSCAAADGHAVSGKAM